MCQANYKTGYYGQQYLSTTDGFHPTDPEYCPSGKLKLWEDRMLYSKGERVSVGGGNVYRADVSHWSGEFNKPESGAKWREYWKEESK